LPTQDSLLTVPLWDYDNVMRLAYALKWHSSNQEAVELNSFIQRSQIAKSRNSQAHFLKSTVIQLAALCAKLPRVAS